MKTKISYPSNLFMTAVLLLAINGAALGFSGYKNMFFQAKSYLASGETEKALVLYQELYKLDTTNANICYLMGVCYTEKKETTPESIRLLKKAANNVSFDYNAADHNEKKVSIFVWYYLAIAYSQNNNCAAAIDAVIQFRKSYGTHKNDYFTRDALNWANRCIEVNGGETDLVMAPEFGLPEAEETIVTKRVEYTAKSPLYAVQIGAFSRLVPLWKFDNLNNVEAFMDKLGTIRYVIGHFNYVSQANTLLRAVWEVGYPDAFIVDINVARKNPIGRYSDEVVMVGDASFKARIRGKVDYRVQIGAYKETIPDELVQLFLMLDGIDENKVKGLTTLTIGSFSSYALAAEKRKKLHYMGIPGCFVVAYNYTRKVSVEEANNFVEKQLSEQ